MEIGVALSRQFWDNPQFCTRVDSCWYVHEEIGREVGLTAVLGKDAGLNAMDSNWSYLLIPMAVALAASLVLTPVVRRLAWRCGWPIPICSGGSTPPVPLLGGVAVYFALVAG